MLPQRDRSNGVSCDTASARAASREAAAAPFVVTARARPHLAGDPFATERPLMSWDARHFHIELSDARLEGGGQLVGRVHRHGDWPPGEIAVTARCLECWRAAALAARGLPHWEFETLWERHHPIRTDLDSTWAPFHVRPAAVAAAGGRGDDLRVAIRARRPAQRPVLVRRDRRRHPTASRRRRVKARSAAHTGSHLELSYRCSGWRGLCLAGASSPRAWARRQTPTVRLDSHLQTGAVAARGAQARRTRGDDRGRQAARASLSHRGIHPGAWGDGSTRSWRESRAMRSCRHFRMPEEGLEPPTRGL